MSAPTPEAAEGVDASADPFVADGTPRVTPGARVRDARERAGVSIEDLAAQLKLSRATLEALERDDYGTLSEAVFVRGYFRKIAKVLPIDADALVADYDANVSGDSEVTPERVPLAGGVTPERARAAPGQGLGLLALAVVAIGALYLFTTSMPLAPDAAPINDPGPQVNPAPAAVAVASTPGDPDPGTVTGAVERAPATEPDPEPELEPEPEPGPEPATPSQAPPAAPPPAALVLDFRDSTFVRVEDARNRTLLIGLVRGGQRETLGGEPPYTVFIGNARNVTVQYAGQPVDLAPHMDPDGDTVRLTIP